MLLPPCLDDYVSKDNPVCALDAFVDTLDLQKLGFEHAKANSGIGQPAFDPALLLKLYLYGTQEGVQFAPARRRDAAQCGSDGTVPGRLSKSSTFTASDATVGRVVGKVPADVNRQMAAHRPEEANAPVCDRGLDSDRERGPVRGQ